MNNRRLTLDKLESRRLLAGDILTVNYYHPNLDSPVIIADNQPAGVEIEGRGTTTAADLNPNVGTLTSVLPVPEVDLVFATGDPGVSITNVTVAAPTLEAVDPFSPILSAGYADLSDGVTEQQFGVVYDNPATEYVDAIVVNGVDAGVQVDIGGELVVTTHSDASGADYAAVAYVDLGNGDGSRDFARAYDFGFAQFAGIGNDFASPLVSPIVALV